MLGPGPEEVRELKFLGRKIRHTQVRLEWEGDDKHVVAFLEKMRLGKSSGVTTLGVKKEGGEEERVAMVAQYSKKYRGLVALLNLYLKTSRMCVIYEQRKSDRIA